MTVTVGLGVLGGVGVAALVEVDVDDGVGVIEGGIVVAVVAAVRFVSDRVLSLSGTSD